MTGVPARTAAEAIALCVCAMGTLPGYHVLTAGHVDLRTASGACYRVDLDHGTWRRVPSLGSGRLRTELGRILALHLAGIGRPAVLECPPLVAGTERRLVVTSEVVELAET